MSLSALWGASQALLAHALITLLLGGAFLLLTWHYVLGPEEKWQIRLWLRVMR